MEQEEYIISIEPDNKTERNTITNYCSGLKRDFLLYLGEHYGPKEEILYSDLEDHLTLDKYNISKFLTQYAKDSLLVRLKKNYQGITSPRVRYVFSKKGLEMVARLKKHPLLKYERKR